MKKNIKLSVRDLTLIAVLTTVLFVSEQLLSFIPNVQLTVFLIVLYSKRVGFVKTSIVTIIHVLLDNLFTCNNPFTCPHGRPTLIVYNDGELDKMFKRTA